MLRTKSLRDLAGVLRFVELLRLKSDGEGLHRFSTRARHQSNDDRRIHAPAQQRSQRYIADQPDADRLFQSPLQLLQALFLANRGVCAVLWQVPVLANLELAVVEFH